jgi:hypothetical protein
MRRFAKSEPAMFLGLALCLAHAGGVSAQDKKQAAVTVPPQIASATKVFLSNAMDMNYQDAARTYNSLYAGLKSWGRYEVVSAPGDADLIFEMRVFGGACGETTPSGACTLITLNVHIVDRATRTILWSINEPWGGAGLTESGREKASKASIEQVIADLFVLSSPGATATSTKPVPPSIVGGGQPKH